MTKWLPFLTAVILLASVLSEEVVKCPAKCTCKDKTILCDKVDPAQLDTFVDEVVAITDESTLERLVFRRCVTPINTLKLVFPATLRVKGLEISDCGINKLGPGVFDNLRSLEELNLADNEFNGIPFLGKLTKLKALNLNKNKVTTIPDGCLSGLDELTHLRLKANNISKLSTNSLSEVKSHLVLLDLGRNGLTSVPAQNIRNAIKLTYLDLSSNRITSLQQFDFMNLIQLKELRLNHNGLASVSPAAFMNIPKLTHLYLKNNQLSSVNSDFLQAFKQMEVLDLSFNMLKNSPSFKDFQSLRNILLTGNKITKLDTMTFSSNPELRIINLSENEIKVISRNSFDSLPKLKNLLLAHNDLTSVPRGALDGIPNVKQITFANNSIIEVSKDSFVTVPEMTVLDLSFNHINKIPKDTFANNTKLFWLDLSENGLEVLEEGAFGSHIGTIILNGNELNCDKGLDWFVRYLVANNVRTFLPEQPEVTCAAPPEYFGTRLKDLMIQKANNTLQSSMRSLGLDQNSQARNDLLQRFLPALGGLGGGSNGASPILGSLTQAIPALRNIPGLSMLPAPEGGGSPSSRNLDSAVEQFAEPLVRIAAGGKALPSDINTLIKSIPNMVVNIPGFGDVDVSKLPAPVVEHVLKGGQIPGVPPETLKTVVKQYMQRMYAAAARAQGKPVDQEVLNNLPNLDTLDKDKYLKPIGDLPQQFVTGVMKGEPLPHLTPSQTEVIKTFYTQGLPIDRSAAANDTGTGFNFNPNVMQMMKLLPPGYDLSKVSPEVTKAVMRGEMPDISLLPLDLQNYIRENMDTMFRSFSNTPNISVDEILRKLPKFENGEMTTYSPYDINNIDSELVVKESDKIQSMRFYIAIALGFVSAVTVVVLVIFCIFVRKDKSEELVHSSVGPISQSTPRRPKYSISDEDQLGLPSDRLTPRTYGTPYRSNLDDSAIYHRHNMSSSHQYV